MTVSWLHRHYGEDVLATEYRPALLYSFPPTDRWAGRKNEPDIRADVTASAVRGGAYLEDISVAEKFEFQATRHTSTQLSLCELLSGYAPSPAIARVLNTDTCVQLETLPLNAVILRQCRKIFAGNELRRSVQSVSHSRQVSRYGCYSGAFREASHDRRVRSADRPSTYNCERVPYLMCAWACYELPFTHCTVTNRTSRSPRATDAALVMRAILRHSGSLRTRHSSMRHSGVATQSHGSPPQSLITQKRYIQG